MTAEMEVHQRQESLPEKIEWAKTMAVANLLPPQYQGNPGNLLYAIEYADALGIDRINAITSIHVIQGKPTASAELIASLVRRAGHKLRVTGDDTQAVAQIIRADDPDFTHEATWDIAKATQAGLWGKGNWRNYPGAMLRARAITEVARAGASDALYGVVYTADELGATVTAEGTPVDVTAMPEAPEEPIDGEVVEDKPTPKKRTRKPKPDAPELPVATVSENGEPLMNDDQRAKMFAQFDELGMKDRADYRNYIENVLGVPVQSSKDLTMAQASAVIESQIADLEAKADARVTE